MERASRMRPRQPFVSFCISLPELTFGGLGFQSSRLPTGSNWPPTTATENEAGHLLPFCSVIAPVKRSLGLPRTTGLQLASRGEPVARKRIRWKRRNFGGSANFGLICLEVRCSIHLSYSRARGKSLSGWRLTDHGFRRHAEKPPECKPFANHGLGNRHSPRGPANTSRPSCCARMPPSAPRWSLAVLRRRL